VDRKLAEEDSVQLGGEKLEIWTEATDFTHSCLDLTLMLLINRSSYDIVYHLAP